MEKIVTYDDTRDVAIRVVDTFIREGLIQENEDNEFDFQDTIHDAINLLLGLRQDEIEEVIIKNIKLNKDYSNSNEEQKRLLTNYTKK